MRYGRRMRNRTKDLSLNIRVGRSTLDQVAALVDAYGGMVNASEVVKLSIDQHYVRKCQPSTQPVYDQNTRTGLVPA